MAEMYRKLIITVFCFFLSIFPVLQLSAHDLPGMANWADNANNSINAQPDQNGVNLLSAPEWMPGYLYKSLQFPRFYFKNSTKTGTQTKLKRAAIATSAIALSLMTKAILQRYQPDFLSSNGLVDIERQLFHPAGMLSNLTSTRTILQLMTTDSIYDGLLRGLVLTGFSRWFEHEYQGINSGMADAPAHFIQWLNIALTLTKNGSPIATGRKTITFARESLNGLFEVTLTSPLTHYVQSSVVSITPLTGGKATIAMTAQEQSWNNLHEYCIRNSIQQIQLYPTINSGVPHLYIRVDHDDSSGRVALLGVVSRNDDTSDAYPPWWTDVIRLRHKMPIITGDPFSPDVISNLPNYIDANLRGVADASLPHLHLKSSCAAGYQSYAAITSEGKGLVFLDWQSEGDKSLLPRMTLVTDQLALPYVSETELEIIQNLQPRPEVPVVNQFTKAIYDIAWLYIATKF